MVIIKKAIAKIMAATMSVILMFTGVTFAYSPDDYIPFTCVDIHPDNPSELVEYLMRFYKVMCDKRNRYTMRDLITHLEISGYGLHLDVLTPSISYEYFSEGFDEVTNRIKLGVRKSSDNGLNFACFYPEYISCKGVPFSYWIILIEDGFRITFGALESYFEATKEVMSAIGTFFEDYISVEDKRNFFEGEDYQDIWD